MAYILSTHFVGCAHIGACNVLIFGQWKKKKRTKLKKSNNRKKKNNEKIIRGHQKIPFKGHQKIPIWGQKDPLLVDSFILHASVSCHLIT